MRNNRACILLSFAMGIALILQPAYGQRPGGGGGGGTGGGTGGAGGGAGGTTGGGRTTPTTNTNPTTDRTQSPYGDMQNRPIFLSGKVQLDDGSVPPDTVVIERVCNGVPRAEGYTDSKGRFTLQLGQNPGMVQDASFSSESDLHTNVAEMAGTQGSSASQQAAAGNNRNKGMTERDLLGCELRAALPGYRSEIVNLSGRKAFDHPEVGTIILHRLGNVEGTTISTTTLQAPKDARKAYDKGREVLRKDKAADAQKNFEKAVEIYPQFASAWYELGQLHEKASEFADARKCYAQASAADAKFINPYMALATLSARDQNWQEVAAATSQVNRLDPVDFPQAYFFNSVANYNLGKIDAAETSAREAQKLDPAHRIPKVDHVLGLILYQKKDYAGAAEQMRKYLMFSPNAPDAVQVKAQLTELEKMLADTKAKTEIPPK
jgi:tetratricopeptide (TPR) repeat protein